MATPDAIGTCSCGNCAKRVYVRKNKGSFAYYRCENCTFEGRFHNIRHSEAFIKSSVSPLEDGDEETGKKPEITANPEAKPAPPPRTPQPASVATVAASKEDVTAAPLPNPARPRTAAERFLYGEG